MAKRKSSESALIPAVGYLRKSTKGEKANGRERQEHSIEQQRGEIEKLAKQHGYLIIRWYSDEGISGWKRDGKRPQFDQMLRDAKDRGDFKAVLCDDLDRFSRADVMEVFADLTALASGSVRTLHCVNQGHYDLGERSDIGKIIKLVVDIHGGHEFSKKLSRRIALTRRNEAREGKRSGGAAPYGYRNDGKGGLIIGEAAQVKVVKNIFRRFTVDGWSMLHIASQLNADGITPPQARAKRWSNATIKLLLTNEAYKGTFTYNKKKQGEFFITDERGEVVEAPKGERRESWKQTEAGVFRRENAHPAIIDAATFEKAQKRIASFKETGKLRTRKHAFPLSGLLVCDHCGSKMYGVKVVQKRGKKTYQHVEYRCEGKTRFGKAVCGYHTVREERILPYMAQQLRDQLTAAHRELLRPKAESVFKDDEQPSRVDELEAKLAEVNARIDLGGTNLLTCSSDRLRKRLNETLDAWQAEADQLEQELAVARAEGPSGGWSFIPTQEDLDAISRWREWLEEKLIFLPALQGAHGPTCDVIGLREVFRQVGTEVRLRWTREEKMIGGKTRYYHQLADGCRFRLGRKKGDFSAETLSQGASSSG